MIDLDEDKTGIYMSRLTETINEVVSRKTEGIQESLEEFGNEILEEIQKVHPYERGEITIKTTLIIQICESSFSSPTFSLLKSEDEKFLVEKMHSNPKFVEDLVRECFEKVKNLGIKAKVHIKAVSYESIHKHNVISEIEREINGGLNV